MVRFQELESLIDSEVQELESSKFQDGIVDFSPNLSGCISLLAMLHNVDACRMDPIPGTASQFINETSNMSKKC